MNAMAPAAPAAERIVVPVALAERSYDILIGRHQLCEAAEVIASRFPGARAAIVTDENLAALHAPALEACLQQAGVSATRLTVPPGEASKSYARFIELCDGLLAAKIERNDLVIALATPRYFADTVRLAEIARKHGAAVLALTDGPHSPLVATATLALYAQTDCHYFAASDASLTALVEALASAFAHATVDLVPAATRVTEAVLPWLDRDYAAWPPQGGADDLPDTPPPGTVP